ncbi:MAG TPA: hypothetical protein VJ965_00500 [Anaerolineales bacterium]|nr:hypothetical protein [Anaerolineales bacterium]
MKKITSGIYLEKDYPGVMIGAVPLGDGVLLIDSPLQPDDGRTWLATLRGLKGGSDRLLVYLDSHPDRTLGGRVMESTIIAHEHVYKIFDERSSIFKPQLPETGTSWETCSGLSGIRWMAPHIAFSKSTRLRWKDAEIILIHQPGPQPGAIWVNLPEEEVLFIGDLVTVTQPPFLAEADLEAWEESLNALMEKEYNSYIKISSRDGVVNDKDIRDMRKFIGSVKKHLERMARRKNNSSAVEKLINKFLGQFDYPAHLHNHYYQRLHYGLEQCYINQYLETE